MTRSAKSSPEPISPPRKSRALALSTANDWHGSTASTAPRRSRGWLVLAALFAIAAALLVPGALGVYFGMQDRANYLHQQAVEHFQRALAYESESDMDLALAELQVALKFEPGYQPALDKLDELQGATPLTVTPTLPVQADGDADELFRAAQTAIANQQWNEAIDDLEELGRRQPDYRAGEVKVLLIQSYLNAGKQSVAAGQIEQARTRFETALKLDPANAQAKSLQARTVLYLNGKQAFGVDWQAAVSNLQQLYALDPAFYDVKQQLWNAHLGYADFASKQGAYCIAAREYEQALSLGSNTQLSDKLSLATSNCRNFVVVPTARPTSIAIATPVPIATVTRAANPTRFTAKGSVDPAAGCQGSGIVTGKVRDARGNPLTSVSIQIYNESGYRPLPVMSQGDGSYILVLGGEPGTYHVVVLNPDGTPASAAYDLNYPGGNANGCHWIVDWTRNG